MCCPIINPDQPRSSRRCCRGLRRVRPWSAVSICAHDRGRLSPLDDHGNGQVSTFVPATFKAYVATRAEDAVCAVEKLVRRYARTGLWTMVTAPLAASIDMKPCRFDASLMLRRSTGMVSAAIAAGTWSITLLGDEAWVDVVSSRAVAVNFVGAPVRTRIDIPSLSPTLRVCGSTQFAAYSRFHCK